MTVRKRRLKAVLSIMLCIALLLPQSMIAVQASELPAPSADIIGTAVGREEISQTVTGHIYEPAAPPGLTVGGGETGAKGDITQTVTEHVYEPAVTPGPDEGGGAYEIISPSVSRQVYYGDVISPSVTVQVYEVAFYGNGGYFGDSGTLSVTEFVYAGEKVSPPAAQPVRDDEGGTLYRFIGWYTEEAGTTAYDFEAAVETDIELYARWAAEVPGDGSGWYLDDPGATAFTISNEAELRYLAKLVRGRARDGAGSVVEAADFSGKTITLFGDIALTGAWMPVGTGEKPFKGNFEGAGHVISGLSIGSTAGPVSENYQGLFGYAQNAGISKLTVTGSVYSTGDYVGGIVGYADVTNTLINCVFGGEAVKGFVSGGNYVGGVAGYCKSAQANSDYANYGTVSGGQYVGGIFGQCGGNFGSYSNDAGKVIINHGAISGDSDVGGILGCLGDPGNVRDMYCPSGNTVENHGAVIGTGANIGGVIGYMSGAFNGPSSAGFNGTVQNTGRVAGREAVGGIVGRTKSHSYGSKPGTEAVVTNDVAGLGADEAGVGGETYVGGIIGFCGGDFVPYGVYENNSSVTAEGDYAGGIVGYLNGGLNGLMYQAINSGNIAGTSYVGGIAGYTGGYVALGSNGVIKNTGTVSGSVYGAAGCVGGIAGWVGTNISNQYGTMENLGAVTGGDNVGGIAGLGKGDVKRAGVGVLENLGAVTGNDNVGGVAGRLAGDEDELELDKVASSAGTVSGQSNVGGIAGLVGGSVAISNSYVAGTVTGAVYGSRGALAGGVESPGDNISITGCYSYLTRDAAVQDLAPAGGTGAAIADSYYLVDDSYSGTDPGAKKADDFRYGALAYAMDKGGTEARGNVWGQKLGVDPVPAFVGEEHPAVYKISVVQNDALGISVNPAAPAGAAWKAYDIYTYANKGMEINLAAAGLDAADDLAFKPIDTVYKDTSGGAPHGSYTVTGIEGDIVISYAKEIKVEGDTGWYGAGTDESFSISSEAELRGLARLVNEEGADFTGKTVTLGADIELTATYWTPIGTLEHPFTGVFMAGVNADNGYFAITGLDMEVSGEMQGFFGYLKDATIQNLTVRGVIKGATKLGGIAGVAENSAFENCTGGVVLIGADKVGGIAGEVSNGTFNNCASVATVTGSGGNVGGIAGVSSSGSFTNCENRAAVFGASNVGGVAGEGGGGSFTNCANASAVTGTDKVGGIVGSASMAATLNGSYNGGAGTVSGTESYTGGVAGYLVGSAVLTGCHNAGTVTGGAGTGGVAGHAAAGSAANMPVFSDCCNDAEASVAGDTDTGGVVGKAGNYSRLTGCRNAGAVTGAGNTGGVAGTLGTYAELDDCRNADTGTVTGTGVGSGANTGGVVGVSDDYAQLADCRNAGAVTGDGESTGGVAGVLDKYAQPVNCCNVGTVSGAGSYTGGVAGTLLGSVEVNGLYNAGTVNSVGMYTGGVIGYLRSVELNGSGDYLSMCYNDVGGVVTSSGDYVGGVVGFLEGRLVAGRISLLNHLYRCYNLGTVGGEGDDTRAAGITGINQDGAYAYALNCFNYGTVSAVNNQNAGVISAAGFPGNQNSYYLNSSLAAQPVDAANATSKTAAEFASGAVAYLLDNGDASGRTENWGQGDSYPVPSNGSHPALYRLTIEMTGPAAGFTANGDPLLPVNGVTLGADTVPVGAALAAYRAESASVTLCFTVKDGYLLDYVEATAADGAICAARVDDAAMTFTFAMPENNDVALTAAFAEVPADLDEIFTVVFDAKGGEWPDGSALRSQQVQVGKRAAEPDEKPVYEDGALVKADFAGWYVDEGCTVPYNFTATVKEDLTLYAGWYLTDRYAVAFDAGEGGFAGGENRMEVVVNAGEAVMQPGEQPARDGYDFRGWYSDEDCLLLYDFAQPVSDDITLYAGWAVEGTCVVIFDAAGGAVTIGDDTAAVLAVIVDSGEKVTAPAAEKTAAGLHTYKLSGWLTKDNTAWNFADSVTESMTLTANWAKEPVTGYEQGTELEIADLASLEELRDNINQGVDYTGVLFTLTDNISLPADWTSIGKELPGSEDTVFAGIFNGGGHTITLNNRQMHALFGTIEAGGVVENLKIEGESVANISAGLVYTNKGIIRDCEISAKLYNCNAGIAYESFNGIFERCTIKEGSVISGGANVAGILALARYDSSESVIRDCELEPGVTVTGSGATSSNGGFGVAGICVYSCGLIEDCVNGADIHGTHPDGSMYVGGIIAQVNSAGRVTIRRCANMGNIYTTGSTAGGIAANGGNGGNLIENCYSIGSVMADGKDESSLGVGGLMGRSVSVTLANSYWYGNFIAVPEGMTDAGAISGVFDSGISVTDCYYGFRESAEEESREEAPAGKKYVTTDPYDENGATKLDGGAFPGGEAAYLLDGGVDSHREIWTQGVEEGYPILGTPSYYQVRSEITGESGGGSVFLNGQPLAYAPIDSRVNVNVEINEYENSSGESGTTYEYKLDSLTVTQKGETEDITSSMVFTLAGDAVVTATVSLKEIEEEEPPEEEEPAPDDDEENNEDEENTGGEGNGDGKGDGEGIGDGDGLGKGDGESIGEGIGDEMGEGGGDSGRGEATTADSPYELSDSSMEPDSADSADVLAPLAEADEIKGGASVDDIVSDEPDVSAEGGGGAIGESEEDEQEDEPENTANLTVFEIVKNAVRQNRLLTAVLSLLILGIAGAGAVGRYRRTTIGK